MKILMSNHLFRRRDKIHDRNRRSGKKESVKLNWEDAARRVKQVYRSAILTQKLALN